MFILSLTSMQSKLKNRITVEHDGKAYEAIREPDYWVARCPKCDLYEECAFSARLLCGVLVSRDYYFKLIGNVQNNL